MEWYVNLEIQKYILFFSNFSFQGKKNATCICIDSLHKIELDQNRHPSI